MTQTIEYVVKVNAAAAQAAIADVEKRFGGVDTIVARLDKNLINLERDIKDLNAAIAAGGPNVEHYKKQLAELQRVAGGAAGGGGMGNRAGGLLQLSQTLDDLQYGIRGVVNNIPGLVQGLGMGAGVAGAAQLAFIAVNQLTDKITGYIKKSQEASQASIKFRNSMLDLQIGAMSSTVELQRRLDDINLQITGGKAASVEEESKRAIQEVDERIANLEQQREKRQSVLESMERLQFRSGAQEKQIAYEKQQIRNINTRLDIERNLKTEAEKQLDLKQKIIKAEETLANLSAGRGGRGGAGGAGDSYDGRTFDTRGMFSTAGLRDAIELAAFEAYIKRAMADSNLAIGDQDDDILTVSQREADEVARFRENAILINKISADLDKERASSRKQALMEIERAEKATADYQVSLASDVTNQMASTFTDYLDAKMRGEEHAEQQAVASFLSSTGQQLVASGVRGVFEGAIMSANPVTPGAGAGMIATGLAAIVAGGAMAAGGSAVSASIPATGGPTGATRDPGASPRPSGVGTGSGGPLIVNVSYGAGGPLPEDVAREIHRTVRSGDRRSGR